MKAGFFGISLPSPSVAFAILFGQYRGIVWIAPILLATPWALAGLWRSHTALTVLIITIAAYYLSVNAGYYYWDGGYSTGPRHITAMLPFVCLPLATLWNDAQPRTRLALTGLLALSVLLSLICASVGMKAGPAPRLLFDYLLPRFKMGAWDGVLLFRFHLLKPQLTLVPLLLLWSGMLLLLPRCIVGPARIAPREALN